MQIDKGTQMTKEEFIEMIRAYHKKMILNKREAAIELGGISVGTLDRMRHDGVISSKKINGQIMFKADEIYRYLYEE